MLKKLVLVVMAIGLLAGCERIKEEYKKGFIPAWRESFVESCSEGENADFREKCECMADKAIEQLTMEQLHDVNYSTKYITEKIVPECMGE